MTEERYMVVKIVESCKSISELDNKLADLESKAIEFSVDSNGDGTITIGVKHYAAQLSTVACEDGRVEPIVKYVDQPWAWYNIMPQKGFIFK